MHPYLIMLIAEQRAADMRAAADRHRRMRAAIASRSNSRRSSARRVPQPRLGPPSEHVVPSASPAQLVPAAESDSQRDRDSQLCHSASR